MTQPSVCPRGHEWDEGAWCPVCGEASLAPDTVRSDEAPVNDLPPPPRDSRPDAWPAVPGYEVLGELGRGGMGVVFKARQLSLNRMVALKLLLSGAFAGAAEVARFRREAEAVARVRHPNIVHVYDVGEHQGFLYCVLEYVEGGTLAQRLKAGRLPPDEAARLMGVLARAVHAAHQEGVIHRDLKPANVLLGRDGQPRVADFGLAKRIDEGKDVTRTGAVLGTPSYMAPEQAQARQAEISPATDVWALGAMLYELLTGRPPFEGDGPFETLTQVVSASPVPPRQLRPEVPEGLERTCLKALEKVPARRFPTALAFAEACEGVGSDRPRPAAAARRRWPVLLGAGVAGVLAVGLALWLAGVGPFARPTDDTGAQPGPGAGDAPAPEWLAITREEDVFDRIAFPTPRVGYAAGRRALYKTEDGGTNWRPLALEAPGRAYVLRFSDAQHGWLGTDRLRATTDGGRTWEEVAWPGDEAMKAVSAFAAGAGWELAGGTTASGELSLMRRRGSGAPEGLSGESAGYWGGPAAPYRKWFLGGLAIVGEAEAVSVLYRGEPPGGAVLRTGDGGRSWKLVQTTEGDLYRVVFTSSRQGLLIGEGGGLWTTDNGGASWRPSALPDGVTPSCLAAGPDGLALAPLWRGRVLLSAGAGRWEALDLSRDGFGYSMPDAAVNAGRAVILSSDGRLARLTRQGRAGER